jgi:hypothetical protein
MHVLDRRLSQRPRVIALAVAIVLTFGVGIGVAGRSGSAQTVTVGDYLARLSGVAATVRSAVGLSENALERLQTPKVGDLYGARDVFATSTALVGLGTARRSLTGLATPSSLSQLHAELVTAVRRMVGALTRIHALYRFDTAALLVARIQRFGDAGLEDAEGDWDRALQSSFSVGHRKAPAGFDAPIRVRTRERCGSSTRI